MSRISQTHLVAYVILLLLLGTGMAFFAHSWPSKLQERWAIAVLSIGYFIWGVVTHVRTKKLTSYVVKEYAAVAFLGGLVLLLLTF